MKKPKQKKVIDTWKPIRISPTARTRLIKKQLEEIKKADKAVSITEILNKIILNSK